MNAELKRRIARLSLEQKVELRDYITEQIDTSPLHNRGRFTYLLHKMEAVLGKNVRIVSRIPDDVWARTMIAYEMILEGYTYAEVGRQMEKDHSTVMHLKKKMEDAISLPRMYGDILPIWYTFKSTIDNDIHERTNGDPQAV